MIVTIHQPTFMPWLGLFHRILHADTFVVFDTSRASNGKSWLTRNKIMLDGDVRWLTVPVHKRANRVRDIKIVPNSFFERKHLASIKSAYQSSPYFTEVYPQIALIYNSRSQWLHEFNTELIRVLLELLEIRTEIVLSSSLIQTSELDSYEKNAVVLEIATRADASVYISGTGCTDFILPHTFKERGVEFVFQDFTPAPYAHLCKGTSWNPALSVLDSLFSIGPSATRRSIEHPVSADKGIQDSL